ncbi:DUF3145 family protein [Amycolatopsis sp. cg9]|uniref:DUF3145 family protein n=1 Tax=Amycolatopsis sp. cg9 TaxID=3238801 RepID=UPI0035238456
MGDWTSGAATIHACPPHRVRTVLDTLAEYDLAYDDAEDNTTLHVGEWYTATEFRCASATDVAHQLINHAPEVAFTVYEEPAYEWIGTTCTYVPELGLFTAGCDTDGDPLLPQKHVLELEGKPDDVRQQGLGVPWLTAIADMPAGPVVEPPRFATHWDRRHGDVVVVAAAQDGGDLAFPAPATPADVDKALAERGFQRVDDWSALDETAQLWRADVYRPADGTDDTAQIHLQF